VPFAAWLFRIASNAISDRYQRASKRNEVPVLDHDSAVDSNLEQRAMLFHLVNSLPDNQRKVVTMRFAEQKSIREIAEELGCSDGAVKQLQIRALQNLRKRMSDSNG
jgi:RNA polymerase sigma-70 factor (ECF subfamily)